MVGVEISGSKSSSFTIVQFNSRGRDRDFIVVVNLIYLSLD